MDLSPMLLIFVRASHTRAEQNSPQHSREARQTPSERTAAYASSE